MSADAVENKGRRRRRRDEAEEAVEAEEMELEDDDEDAGSLTPGKGRATPGRRTQIESAGPSGNILVRAGRGMQGYFEGVQQELRKVSWPTRADIRRLTGIVLAVTITFALVLGTLDFAFTELFRIGLGNSLVLAIVLVIIVVLGGGFLFYHNRSSDDRTSSRRRS